MTKDKQARRDNRITLMAMANMLAAIVDALREADAPNSVTHAFLDKFDRLNTMTLTGYPAVLMAEFVDLMRTTVASND